MKLIPVDPANETHLKVLYDLLSERPAEANISHAMMPFWEQHCAFVRSEPYQAWWMIDVGGVLVGATYLSKQDEIGIGIRKPHQGKRYGPTAVRLVRSRHPSKRLLANVAPNNERSRKMFEKLGFKTIQHTLALEAE